MLRHYKLKWYILKNWVRFNENVGRSVRQYEIRLTKINVNSGKPKNPFVYGGYDINELIDLAANNDMTAVLFIGTSNMIWKRNIKKGQVPYQGDQLYPNNKTGWVYTGVHNGFDSKHMRWYSKTDPEIKNSLRLGIQLRTDELEIGKYLRRD